MRFLRMHKGHVGACGCNIKMFRTAVTHDYCTLSKQFGVSCGSAGRVKVQLPAEAFYVWTSISWSVHACTSISWSVHACTYTIVHHIWLIFQGVSFVGLSTP